MSTPRDAASKNPDEGKRGVLGIGCDLKDVWTSLRVSVSSFETKQDEKGQFTVYVLSVQCVGNCWSVKKRFSEFESLRENLKEHTEGISFPGKSLVSFGVLWGGASAAAAVQDQLIKRCADLDRFMCEMLARRIPTSSQQVVFDFLEVVAATDARDGRLGFDTLQSIDQDDVAAIKFWLDDPAAHIEDRESSTGKGHTALVYAARKGASGCLKMLLQRGADPAACLVGPLGNGATALYVATQQGHLECVDALILAGSPINQSMAKGATPLYLASDMGHVNVVRRLVQSGAYLNARTGEGSTALTACTWRGDLKVMALLLDAGANPNSTDNNGCSCVWIASKKGDAEAVQLLVTRGANVCMAYCTHYTLHCTHYTLHSLLQVCMANKEGATPAYVANLNAHEKCFELLLQAGATLPAFIGSGQIAHEAAAGKAAAASEELRRREEFVALYQAAQCGSAQEVDRVLDTPYTALTIHCTLYSLCTALYSLYASSH
jgi:ankyrin repeat protein